MVQMQYAYEGKVDCDLSGSGVPSLALSDLVNDADEVNALLEASQNYTPSSGSQELCSGIVSLYRNVTAENILITNGATEANFMAAWHLLDKDDEIVVMVPGYLQTLTLARSWGLKVHPLPLSEDLGWQ
ncbi:MAG: aminotransferase class I/II-fold pyridoxal phosphate-dependent enzyme, partial [Methanobacteriota archaeon]